MYTNRGEALKECWDDAGRRMLGSWTRDRKIRSLAPHCSSLCRIKLTTVQVERGWRIS